MKEALKRAAQAVGFMAAPVVEAEAPDTVVDDATNAVEAAEKLEAEDVVNPEMITHTFEAPATAASYHAVVTELAQAAHTIETLQSELAALHEANAQAAATALAAKMAAREAAIVAELGTDRAAAFMTATAGMPDAQFETIMAAMSASTIKEADKPEFKEVGVEAQADVDALQAEAAVSGTEAILRDKYQKAK